MNRWKFGISGLFSFGLGLGVAACGDSGSNGDCTPGALYCSCVTGLCADGLECAGNLCVQPSDETGNPGDGDGDSGDGDGDSGDGDPGDGDPGDGDGDNPCDAGQSLCDGQCIKTQSDPLNCGGCGNACGAGEVCEAGDCVFIEDCAMQECPGLSYCDLGSKQCLPGCIADDQCVGGEECNLGNHECECNAPGTCTDDDECGSGSCYVFSFSGGQCGECSSDSDCQWGCTPHNPFAEPEIGPNCTPIGGPYCNDGGAGEGCQTNSACQGGLVCATSFDFLSLLQLRTCGECIDDSDCGSELCTPVVNLQSFTGQKQCMPAGSLTQNSPCEYGDGDATCASGFCSGVNVMGLDIIGACGECKNDDDCGIGETCTSGQFDYETGVLTGSTCS